MLQRQLRKDVDSLAELCRIEDPLDIFDNLLLEDFVLDFGLDAEDLL